MFKKTDYILTRMNCFMMGMQSMCMPCITMCINSAPCG